MPAAWRAPGLKKRTSRKIKKLTGPRLLVIEEVGSISVEAAHASLLFRALCERYQKQHSVILTSNKAFADWGQIFAHNAVMASASLDRLLHRATVIHIRGDSFRLKETRQANAAALSQEAPHR